MCRRGALAAALGICVSASTTFGQVGPGTPPSAAAVREPELRAFVDSVAGLSSEAAQLDAYLALGGRDLDLVYAAAQPVLARGTELVRRIGTPGQRAAFAYARGRTEAAAAAYAKAAESFSKARVDYAEAGDSLGVWRVRHEQAKLLRTGGATSAAAASLLELRENFARVDANRDEAEVLLLLSTLAVDIADAPRAIAYARAAVTAARSTAETWLLAFAQDGLAYALLDAGHYGEALVQIDSAVAYWVASMPQGYAAAQAHATRANILQRLGRYGESLAAYDRVAEGHPLAETMFYLGGRAETLMSLGREREARALADTVMERTRRGGYGADFLAAAYLTRAVMAAPSGAYPAALANLERGIKIKDSFTAAANARDLLELETQYRTAAKDAEIALQAETLALERARSTSVTIGLALSLAAVAAVAYLAFKLRQRNREREVLIREVHHRVKNNLQTLSSLLYLQGRHLDDEVAAEALRASQARVEAMGLIHERLYTRDSLTGVHLPDYVRELAGVLVDAYGMDERVRLDIDAAPIDLHVDTAIPLGLILNELIANSLKYAFRNRPVGKPGHIHVYLREEGAELVLGVGDDGDGTGAEVLAAESTGFGTELVGLLAEKLQAERTVEATAAGFATTLRIRRYQRL